MSLRCGSFLWPQLMAFGRISYVCAAGKMSATAYGIWQNFICLRGTWSHNWLSPCGSPPRFDNSRRNGRSRHANLDDDCDGRDGCLQLLLLGNAVALQAFLGLGMAIYVGGGLQHKFKFGVPENRLTASPRSKPHYQNPYA